MNTVRQANGEIVTGKVWRQQHFYFHRLPFYSNIPRMDEMVVPLKMALAKVSGHERFCALLLKLGQGLDDVHPFSYTEGVDKLMCDAEKILSPDSASVSAKNASQIWAFMSKFVMVDRLARTLGVAEVYGGNSVPRQPLSREEFAGASYLLDEMNPPTKIVQKFLKTWGNRDQNRSQYSKSSQASGLKDSNEDAAGVALTLSRRLIGIVRVKHVLNIEAGLEMMALGITLSSENSGVFPETVKEVDAVLRRIWSNRLEDEQLQEISQQMQLLHSSIKNIMEYVFATSPLLALSTNSWKRRISGAHLLTLFNALGNNRPSILIRLEDQVLQAIVGISEGKPRTEMMDELYSQIGSLEKDLADDEDAMNWFNFTTAASISSTPAASDIRSTPLPDDSEIPPTLHEKFKGGLASPPESPQVAWSSHHALALKPISSPQPIHKSLDVPVVSSSPTSSALPAEPPAPLFAEPGDREISSPQPIHKSPDVPVVVSSPTSSALPSEPPTPLFIEPSDPDVAMDLDTDELGKGKPQQSTQVQRASPSPSFIKPHPDVSMELDEAEPTDAEAPQGDLVPESKSGRRSRTSSLSSVTDASDMEVDDQRGTVVQLGVEEDSDVSEDESDSENGEDNHMTQETDSSDGWKDEGTIDDRSNDNALSDQLAEVGLRRSSRNKQTPQLLTPLSAPTIVVQRTAIVRKARSLELEDGQEDGLPKLSDVRLATFHPTMYADITGWGSTIEAGAKPYRHRPVQITQPGLPSSTGDDTDTLRKVEAHIKAGFCDGLPPHLQPNASSLEYTPGSEQSRIFVSSYSDFSRLDSADIQGVLRQRLILVHGHPFDYNYGWDLESMGRLYDVDKKVSVLVSSLVHPLKPDVRHRQGTLREFHRMTTPVSNQEFPPLNALSLPTMQRNLFLPCQFGSLGSHEVAQSRLPSAYATTFGIQDVKPHLEWSLVGAKGAISPFHVDSEGLATSIVVLEGSKYWIVATRLGEDETISTVDSLGPDWHPYHVNDGDNMDRFRFEAVHLQKGDMLIMPPGVPHWVVSTSNAICVGRHFYASSTIRFSVVGIVHAFLLGGALTNEDHLQTRTLLYQLLVFWSMRIDTTDIDGAHIPRLSFEEEFLDIVYLGIFVILSPAFDRRFYSKPPPSLVDEVSYAIRRFHCLMHVFSLRYIIMLQGKAVAASYVVDRMLAEFAAAAVIFARDVGRPFGEGNETAVVPITFPQFLHKLQAILADSCPDVVPFFSARVQAEHKNFFWTGPTIGIVPRTEEVLSLVMHLTGTGELLDYSGCPLYIQEVDDHPSAPATPIQKRDRPEEGMKSGDQLRRKRKH